MTTRSMHHSIAAEQLIWAEPIREFLDNVSLVQGAYQQVWFHYVAIKTNSDYRICRGQLSFFPSRPAVPATMELTRSIQAGCFSIAEFGYDIQQFLLALCQGAVNGPLGPLRYFGDGSIKLEFVPLLPEARQERMSRLILSHPYQTHDERRRQYDWELRACSHPYDNLDEVAHEYRCGQLSADDAIVDIVLPNVAAVTNNSTIQGSTATVELTIAAPLDESKANLGYRVIVAGRCIERSTVIGSQFSWQLAGGLKFGRVEFTVPTSSLLQCFAIYDGVAQHVWYIGDPANSQNPRRAALEAFDPSLSIVREAITPLRKGNAREFESGVSALFWLLGFGVAHLNGPKHGDSVDLIATSLNGNMALIECTTGLLREDTKMAKLLSRTHIVRQRLNQSGASHIALLPTMVTSKHREEIKSEVETANRDGIYVLAREDILELLDNTILLSNADSWFQAAHTSLTDASRKAEA